MQNTDAFYSVVLYSLFLFKKKTVLVVIDFHNSAVGYNSQ